MLKVEFAKTEPPYWLCESTRDSQWSLQDFE